MGRERRTRNGRSNGQKNMTAPWVSGWFDAELRELFQDDPSLYETAHRLRASRPEATPHPQYRARLRAALMTEAEATLGRQHRLRRWLGLGPRHIAWGGAAAGVALIAATALAVFSSRVQDHATIQGTSVLTAQHNVSPEDVITVSFNQPMDQAAVVAGLHIQPATEVVTAWQGNELVITPVHHLVGNTPYTVKIDQASLRSTVGAVAAAPVEITFGTAATPPPVDTTGPPQLNTALLGHTATGSQLLFAPDGSVVSTQGNPPASGSTQAATPSASPAASPSASSSPSASPSASPSTSPSASTSPSSSPSPSASVTPTPAAVQGTVAFAPTGTRTLGGAASAAAFSPGGGSLALAVPSSGGTTQIIASLSDGSGRNVLATVSGAVTAIAWSSNDRIVFATANQVQAVTLSGHLAPATPLPGGSGAITRLSPNAAYAYVAPASGTGGTLWDLAHGSVRTLDGSAGDVAFSADSRWVSWVDHADAHPTLRLSPVDRDAAVTVSTLSPGAALAVIALNDDGTAVAYDVSPAGAPAQLIVAALPSGSPLAVGPATSDAAFTHSTFAFIGGDRQGPTVELAHVPGIGTSSSQNAIPAGAVITLNAFVDAQISGDTTTLGQLSAGGATFNPSSATPRGLSRAYVITSVANGDGTVNANVELIVDPTVSHPVARVANETLTLSPANGSLFQVSAMNVTNLHDEADGPHVVHVDGTTSNGQFVVHIAFDSDLAQGTVPNAIALVAADGSALQSTTTYDANTRTATVTLNSLPAGVVGVQVTTQLQDVNGNALASPFTAAVGTAS